MITHDPSGEDRREHVKLESLLDLAVMITAWGYERRGRNLLHFIQQTFGSPVCDELSYRLDSGAAPFSQKSEHGQEARATQ